MTAHSTSSGVELPLVALVKAGNGHWRTTSSGTLRLVIDAGAAPVRPAPGVRDTLLDNGYLELVSDQTGRRYFCHPIGAAMWISLRDHDGRLDLAARHLAEAWEADEKAVRADLGLWVDELCDAGLLRLEP
jgi:hypothetical protein